MPNYFDLTRQKLHNTLKYHHNEWLEKYDDINFFQDDFESFWFVLTEQHYKNLENRIRQIIKDYNKELEFEQFLNKYFKDHHFFFEIQVEQEGKDYAKIIEIDISVI